MVSILDLPHIKIRLTSGNLLIVSLYGLMGSYHLPAHRAEAYRALHIDYMEEELIRLAKSEGGKRTMVVGQ